VRKSTTTVEFMTLRSPQTTRIYYKPRWNNGTHQFPSSCPSHLWPLNSRNYKSFKR